VRSSYQTIRGKPEGRPR